MATRISWEYGPVMCVSFFHIFFGVCCCVCLLRFVLSLGWLACVVCDLVFLSSLAFFGFICLLLSSPEPIHLLEAVCRLFSFVRVRPTLTPLQQQHPFLLLSFPSSLYRVLSLASFDTFHFPFEMFQKKLGTTNNKH